LLAQNRRIRGIEVSEVAVGVDLIVEVLRDQAMVVAHVEVRGSAIVLPVGDTIAYKHALEVRYPLAGVPSLIDEPVKSQHDLRHVDPSVRFTRDPHLVVLEGSKLVAEKSEDNSSVVIGRVIVIPLAVFKDISAHRVPDVGRALDVKDVRVVVPRPVIESEVVSAILKGVGTVLLGPPKHGRAARATVEPDDHRVSLGIVPTEGSDVVILFRGIGDWDVSRVEPEGDVWLLPQLSDKVFCRVPRSLGSHCRSEAHNCEYFLQHTC
jgi:hypothetical protein